MGGELVQINQLVRSRAAENIKAASCKDRGLN